MTHRQAQRQTRSIFYDHFGSFYCHRISPVTRTQFPLTLSSRFSYSTATMIRAGVGQSQQQATGQAVEEAARQALARAGISRADLAIMFFTADHAGHARDLVSSLISTVGTDCVVGSSGAGVLTGEGEIEGRGGVVVLVVASDAIIGRPFIFEPLKGNETHLGASFGEFVAKAQDN